MMNEHDTTVSQELPAELSEIPENEAEYSRKEEYVRSGFEQKMENVGKKIRFAQDVIALFRYMTDPEVKWYRKAVVVSALAYFISPIDAIPDLAPLVGYLDDFGVIAAVTAYMAHELKPYYS